MSANRPLASIKRHRLDKIKDKSSYEFGKRARHHLTASSESSSCTASCETSTTTSIASSQAEDGIDLSQFIQWAKNVCVNSNGLDLVPNYMNYEDGDTLAPLSYTERCHSCGKAFVLIEHSGVLRCTNTLCKANGRRINIVDADMSCLPFGADISYKSMALVRDDLQLCEADRTMDLGVSAGDNESVTLLPGNTSLFNSLVRGCASSTAGNRCQSSDGGVRIASDGFCTISSHDAHFKHLCTVFGYATSRKINVAKPLSSSNPYAEQISPSLVVYIQTCLCKTLCASLPHSHSIAECVWKKYGATNIAEIGLILSRLAKDTKDGDWKTLAKRPSFVVNLLSNVLGYVPRPPSEALLSKACQYFVVARRAKMEEFVVDNVRYKAKPFKAEYVWHKIWQLLDPKSQTFKFFPIPSNKDRIHSLDRWWKKLCTLYGWQYLPTSPLRIDSKMMVHLSSSEDFESMSSRFCE